jgi:hypothetical protein
MGRFTSPDSVVPGASSGIGGAGGIIGATQNHKLTVDFHENSAAVSSDGGDTSGPFNPQALNRYSYVLNNPIRYVDPTGHGMDCGLGMPCSSSSGSKATPTAPPTSTPPKPGKTPVPGATPNTPVPNVSPTPTATPEDVYVSESRIDKILAHMLSAPIANRPIMPYSEGAKFTAGLRGAIQAHHILE